MRRLLIVALMVVAVSACADDSVGDSASTASSIMTSLDATDEVEFPDHIENHQDLGALTGQQLDMFVGMTEEAGREFAEEHGFILKVAGPGHESVTAEPCLCVYAWSDADGVIISMIDS